MEKVDLMNVDSFSQLPFIRPAPSPKDKGGSIRLFGIEFGGITMSTTTPTVADPPEEPPEAEAENALESGRKFECHYCCRNFPTSQALGGHQNAHKRERQHAKRAMHVQSALQLHGDTDAAAARHHPVSASLLNYHRLAHMPPPSAVHYPTWSNNTTTTNNSTTDRYYCTITGHNNSTWRIPTTNRDRTMQPLPLFGSCEMMNSKIGGSTVMFESKNKMQDHHHHHVSLDLHL